MAPPPIPDEEWERIWAPLEAQGWRHEGVPGGVNYFFPPGVVKVSHCYGGSWRGLCVREAVAVVL